jgi:hypothetical protein
MPSAISALSDISPLSLITNQISTMASRLGLGVPLPMLAPATATWAAPMAAYYIFLQNRVVYYRLQGKTYVW